MTGVKRKSGKFTTVLCSDIDYEHLFAAIEYDGVEIAIVTQEDGKEAMKIEASFGDPVKPGIAWVVELDGFLAAVATAKQRLMDR
jgi:hypothetical protein